MANETIIPETLLPELRRKVLETGITILVKKEGKTFSVLSAEDESWRKINTPCQTCAKGVHDCIKYGAPFPRKLEDYKFCSSGFEIIDPKPSKSNVVIEQCEDYVPSRPTQKLAPLEKRDLRETIACIYYDAGDMEEVLSIRSQIEMQRRNKLNQNKGKKKK